MRFIYHPEADAEVIESARYYNSRQGGLGGRFLVMVDKAVDSILEDPTRLPLVDDEVRRCPVDQFPYSIVFAVVGDTVIVIAVAHHSRDPDYWKGRI